MGLVTTFLITGAEGLLGPYLVEEFRKHGRVVTSSRNSGDLPCDLTSPDAVRALLTEAAPTHVLHAAALTNVDRCELEPDVADAGNRLTTANLMAAKPSTSQLVYLSTDQVYPNTAGPHREGTETPINVYGRSKLAGELAAAEQKSSLIVRTNLFGPSRTEGRASLSDFVARSLGARKPITMFRDVLFSPLHMTTLAAFLADMVKAELTGIVNLGSRNGLSKLEFGLAVAAQLKLPIGGISVGLSTSVATRAPRPLDLRLDVERVERLLGRVMPNCIDEITRL